MSKNSWIHARRHELVGLISKFRSIGLRFFLRTPFFLSFGVEFESDGIPLCDVAKNYPSFSNSTPKDKKNGVRKKNRNPIDRKSNSKKKVNLTLKRKIFR